MVQNALSWANLNFAKYGWKTKHIPGPYTFLNCLIQWHKNFKVCLPQGVRVGLPLPYVWVPSNQNLFEQHFYKLICKSLLDTYVDMCMAHVVYKYDNLSNRPLSIAHLI